jgi:hypothetical protein
MLRFLPFTGKRLKTRGNRGVREGIRTSDLWIPGAKVEAAYFAACLKELKPGRAPPDSLAVNAGNYEGRGWVGVSLLRLVCC